MRTDQGFRLRAVGLSGRLLSRLPGASGAEIGAHELAAPDYLSALVLGRHFQPDLRVFAMPLELEVAKGGTYIPLVNCDHRIPFFEWSL